MKTFFKLTLLITILFFQINYLKAQTPLFTENFNTGSTSQFTLNTTDKSCIGADGSDEWIINKSYTGGECSGGCGVSWYCEALDDQAPLTYGYMDTKDQPSGIVGSPQSNYLHIAAKYLYPADISNTTFLGKDGGGTFGCFSYESNFMKMNIDVSTVGLQNVTLHFWYLCGGGAASYNGQVYYSTDGGTNWKPITPAKFYGKSDWTKADIHMDEFNNLTSLRFGWLSYNHSSGTTADPSFAVDDIIIDNPASSGNPPVANFTTVPEPPTICSGDSINFTDASSGSPTSWSWVFEGSTNKPTSTEQNPKGVHFVTSGSHTVTLVATNAGGASTPKTTTITVSATVPEPQIHISGNTLTSDDAVSYQWYKYVGNNPEPISGATNKSFSDTQAGVTYYVKVGNANGCAGNQSAPVLFTSVNNLELLNEINMYPSPVSNELTIENKSSIHSSVTIEIFNVTGQMIIKKEFTGSKSVIDMSSYSAGTYFVKATNASVSGTVKIVKE